MHASGTNLRRGGKILDLERSIMRPTLTLITQLRVVDLGKPEDCYVSNGRERIMATLSLIQRALASAPTTEPIPNIEFPISYDDMPTRSTHGVSWGFTRKQDEQNVWLIPDYGYWSWWAVGIPSLRSVWRRVQELEQSLKWQQKIPKAIWRGTTHLNPVIRDRLVDTAEATTWGDVQRTSKGEEDNNWLTLDAHCKYVLCGQMLPCLLSFRLTIKGTNSFCKLKVLRIPAA